MHGVHQARIAHSKRYCKHFEVDYRVSVDEPQMQQTVLQETFLLQKKEKVFLWTRRSEAAMTRLELSRCQTSAEKWCMVVLIIMLRIVIPSDQRVYHV